MSYEKAILLQDSEHRLQSQRQRHSEAMSSLKLRHQAAVQKRDHEVKIARGEAREYIDLAYELTDEVAESKSAGNNIFSRSTSCHVEIGGKVARPFFSRLTYNFCNYVQLPLFLKCREVSRDVAKCREVSQKTDILEAKKTHTAIHHFTIKPLHIQHLPRPTHCEAFFYLIFTTHLRHTHSPHARALKIILIDMS